MEKFLNIIRFVNSKILVRFQTFIMVTFICTVLLMLGQTIIARNILKFDIFAGSEEIILIMTAWLYFMSGTLASNENSHLDANLLSNILKTERAKIIQRIFTATVTTLAMAVMSVWGVQWLIRTVKYGAVSNVYHYPTVWLYMPVFLFFMLSFIYFLSHCIRAIVDFRALKELSE